jgi:hypothetical protein
MIERNYDKYILDDGSAPLRVLVKSKTETVTKPFEDAEEESSQVSEKIEPH